jgi:hypothetical protein
MTREYRKTFKAVRILVAGKYKTVHTVLGAGNALLEFPSGDAQRSASRAVLDNFNDTASPQDVRRKLIAAAFEAHVPVKD